MATGEYSYRTPLYTLRVWISRSLHGAEIDRHGQRMLDDIERNPLTMEQILTAVTRQTDDWKAGRKEPLTSSRVLADRLSRIRVPTETDRRSIAMIRAGTREAALLELS